MSDVTKREAYPSCISDAPEEVVAAIQKIAQDTRATLQGVISSVFDVAGVREIDDMTEAVCCYMAPELLAEALRLREEVGKLRALLLGVLENDEAAEGFNNANLGQLRDEIRNAVAWKIV